MSNELDANAKMVHKHLNNNSIHIMGNYTTDRCDIRSMPKNVERNDQIQQHRHAPSITLCKLDCVLAILCQKVTGDSINRDTTTTTELPFKPMEVPTGYKSDLLPEYWRDFRDWTEMTGVTRSFCQKYAYCTEYAWKQGCEQFRIAQHGTTHHMKTHMADMTKNITNLDEEENPLKCHWSELWTNKTNQMAIYAAIILPLATMAKFRCSNP